MELQNKTFIKGVALLMLVFAFLSTSTIKTVATGSVIESTMTINIAYSGNYTSPNALHRANMSNSIFVGAGTSPFGTGSVTIPLTNSGVLIIDNNTTDNVPGLHIVRRDGFIEIAAYGENDPDSRENIKATFSFTNVTITSTQNDPDMPYENEQNGSCGVIEGNDRNSNPQNDEYSTSGNSGSLCSSVNTNSDIFRIFYNIQQPTNHPPVANAGPDKQVNENQSVILSGSGYDPDGDTVAYSWLCSGGTLSNSNQNQPTYVAPSVLQDTNYNCTLTVTDTAGASDTDTAVVAVRDQVDNLTVSCYATSNPVNANQTVSFISNVSGGNGSYAYSWSGACTGSSQVCTNSISQTGTQTATVSVTSGSQSDSANCSVTVNKTCTQNYQQRCLGNSLYWYDSCGSIQGFIQYCASGCSNNTCVNQTCTQNYQQRCLGNSLYWYNSCGDIQSFIQYCADGCSNNTCQYNNTNLTVVKTVRNLTNGSGFASSTYASPSDMLMFMITLQATGNRDIQNVYVRDVMPLNLIYGNQLIVARSNNAYSNYSGDITSGINLNTISAGQTVTITYQARVAPAQNFSYGATTLNNSVSVTNSNLGYNPTSNASVVVTRSAVLAASTISTGLTNNFWLDSFLLPLLVALVGIWMWKSGIFFGIEKWLNNRRKIHKGYKAEKELTNRIATIKKSEGI